MKQIKKCTINDIQKLIALLNEVTLNLHNKNINQWDYPWTKEMLEEDIQHNNLYKVVYEDNLIATFSMKHLEENETILIKSDVNYLYRIAILPENQGKGVGKEILNYCFKNLNERDIYLDCWAGNDRLKDFYLKEGLKYIGDEKEEDYYISVFKYKRR